MWLAISTTVRFQTLVTLTGGVLAILAVIGAVVWRTSLWIKRQADAVRANTEALVGSDRMPGLISTVASMQRAVEALTQEIHVGASPRGRRGR